MTQKVFIKLAKRDSKEDTPLVKRLRHEVYEQLDAEGKADKQSDVYFGIASTAGLDRDEEVLIPRGVQTNDFMTNPVMLHIHDYRQVSVGKVLKLGVTDEEVGMAFMFAETDQGQELRSLYDGDFMSAFSVGFIPRSVMRIDDDTPDKIDIEVPSAAEVRTSEHVSDYIKGEDGEYTLDAEPAEKFRLDLTKYDRRPRAVVSAWELLEVSPVPVPSNPEALLVRAVRKACSRFTGPAKAFAEATLGEALKTTTTTLEEFLLALDDFELRGSVARHTTPIDNEASWDGSAARATLARWASSDNTGSKETMDWGKFSRGYGWFDSNAIEAFGSYKLPHHVIRDGELVGIWRGITTAMGALLGARGGVDVGGDTQAVYNHLAQHYRDNDREPPPLTREYDEADLKGIVEDTWKAEDHIEEDDGYEIVDGKAIRTSGSAAGHSHRYDDAESGETTGGDGNQHSYTRGAQFTGVTNGHRHSLTFPNMSENVEEGAEPDDDVYATRDQSGSPAVLERLDELEATLGVRLGVIGEMVEELSDMLEKAVRKDLDDVTGNPPDDDGENAGGDATPEAERALQEGAEKLAEALGRSID
jgi:hypothetical protein